MSALLWHAYVQRVGLPTVDLGLVWADGYLTAMSVARTLVEGVGNCESVGVVPNGKPLPDQKEREDVIEASGDWMKQNARFRMRQAAQLRKYKDTAGVPQHVNLLEKNK